MNRLYLFVIVFLFSSIIIFPQNVGQWLYVGDTEFSNMTTRPLSSAKSKFLATITASTSKGNILQLSDDGGNTWYNAKSDAYYYTDSSAKPKPASHKREYQAVERPSENHIIILVTDNIWWDGTTWAPYIYMTTDKGKTWDTVTISPKIVKSYYNFLLSMLNDNYGLVRVVLYDSVKDKDVWSILRTNDGGKNWEPINIPDSAGMNLLTVTGIQIIDVDEFCLFSSSGIYYINLKTNSFITKKFPTTNLSSFSITPGRIIYASGKIPTGLGAQAKDLIYKTTDFGISWIKLLDSLYDADIGLDYINFYDDNNGIAVGDLSRILRTTDGGLNWTLDPPPFPYYQVPFSFVNYFSGFFRLSR